jgi:predicted phage baseplate assembly protein
MLRQPTPGSRFLAVYRVGNGAPGNVGTYSLTQIVSTDARLAGCLNILPAAGGSDPEPLEIARLAAPESLYQQERCVTAADYEEIAEREPDVRKARAIDGWSGTWRSTCLYVQRRGGQPVDEAFLRRVRARVAPALLAGADLRLTGPVGVPLEILLTVKVADGFRRSQVERLLHAALGDGEVAAAGGTTRKGFFHPDRFTFGQSVYLARLLDAARKVPGVGAVEALVFKRQGEPDAGELLCGEIAFAPQEVAVLRTGPAAVLSPPDAAAGRAAFGRRGRLTLRLEGGQ